MKMLRSATVVLVCIVMVLHGVASVNALQTDDGGGRSVDDGDAIRATEDSPRSVDEARGRARLLHETLHGALQVMHRDFFREDEGLKIPSRSLEDVFKEVASSYGVRLRWIAVDTKAMNIDNEAKSDFEKQAVAALKSGKKEYETGRPDEYRFAGRIRLSAGCLSCHASRRSSNADRAAGLVIVMPLKTGEQITQ